MDPRIKNILEYAIMAPSGDNCQPWRFNVAGMTVELFNDPGQDTSLYNLKQRASLLAHGALLETVDVAAPAVGLQPDICLLPKPDNDAHIATITFSEAPKQEYSLFKAIPHRHTNREHYQPVKLSDSQVEGWMALSAQEGERVGVAYEPQQVRQLADLLSYNDRLVFEVAELHEFLFEQIRWTDIEARQTGDGLDIKTLGLNTMDRLAFRFLKNFTWVSVLNNIGFSRIVQMKARQTLRSASAVVAVAVSGAQVHDYLAGGRLWQRLLLQLSYEGLAVQPIAGLACLMQSQREGLLPEHCVSLKKQQHLEAIRLQLFERMELDEESVLVGLFRVGRGTEVVRALRRPLSAFFLEA